MLPATTIALATVAVALILPDRYESESTLAVVQQQVAQTLVAPIAETTVGDAINSMTREVLSRSQLLAIIEELDLYPEDRKNSTPNALLAERMRKDLAIEPLELPSGKDSTAFKISFFADNPQLAQRVVTRLTSLFINETLKARGNQATRTTDFLNEQVAAAKQKLDEQEQRLAAFKTSNLGGLPEQQASNIETLAALRMQLATVSADERRANEQRNAIESSVEGNVARLESERNSLLNRLTPRHPDVVKKEQEIAKMQMVLERLKSRTSISGQPPIGDNSAAQLTAESDKLRGELENLSEQGQRLKTQISQYEQRINLTPLKEQQLASILRNYDLFKQDYADLVNKQIRSQQSATVEERQEGQHFRLVDPPTLPAVPSGPKRLKISLGGVAGGIAVGLVLAFLMNVKKSSFYSDKELKRHFSVPLVVSVPVLLTASEQRGQNRKLVLEWVAAAAMTLVVCAAEFYVFQRG